MPALRTWPWVWPGRRRGAPPRGISKLDELELSGGLEGVDEGGDDATCLIEWLTAHGSAGIEKDDEVAWDRHRAGAGPGRHEREQAVESISAEGGLDREPHLELGHRP